MKYFLPIIFIIAASFGVINLIGIYKRNHAPAFSAICHGALVGVGLLLLIIYVVTSHISLTPLYIFLATAAGGLFLMSRDVTKKRVPLFIGIIHGIAGISGIVCLIYFLFCYSGSATVV